MILVPLDLVFIKDSRPPDPLEFADFTAVPGLNRKRVLDLFTCRFIQEKASVVLLGAPGVGKSHLAVALGREACRQGHQVKFFTASHLVNTYLEAREQLDLAA